MAQETLTTPSITDLLCAVDANIEIQPEDAKRLVDAGLAEWKSELYLTDLGQKELVRG